MTVDGPGTPRTLSGAEAGAVLGLPADVVRVLADAGYLQATLRNGIPRFAMDELKAFQARTGQGTATAPEQWDLAVELDAIAPDDLLALLDGETDRIAARMLELLQTALPESRDWTDDQRERFLVEAKARIEAILAVCARGPDAAAVDALAGDLAEIGADAAHHGVPLPGVLVAVRVSRDLMVQSAVEAAERRGRRWGLALAVALTRVLPAVDRLSDAVARGYWDAVLEIEAEGLDRFRTLADRVSDGVFALDADGVVAYVNPALAAALRTSADRLLGRHVRDAFGVDPGVAGVVAGRPAMQVERLRDGVAAGWDGIVQGGEGGLCGGEDPGAAAGVVDGRHDVVDEPGGDGPERVGGRAVAEGDRLPGVAAQGDGRFERDLADERSAGLGGEGSTSP